MVSLTQGNIITKMMKNFKLDMAISLCCVCPAHSTSQLVSRSSQCSRIPLASVGQTRHAPLGQVGPGLWNWDTEKEYLNVREMTVCHTDRASEEK